MAKLYYTLVKAGTWKIEQVPSLWKAEVEDARGRPGVRLGSGRIERAGARVPALFLRRGRGKHASI